MSRSPTCVPLRNGPTPRSREARNSSLLMEERGFQPDKLMSAGCPPVLGVLLKRVTGTKLLWRSLVPLYAHSLKHFGMKNPYCRGKTVDDLLRYVLQSIEKYGEPVKASKGHTREITGVVLE